MLFRSVDRVYPASHRDLASAILENGGALVSEYPPGTEVRRYRFPERNRLISGLSRAVVVAQAPEKSGALITADYALEQGRDLMVHRSGLQGAAGAGGRRLAVDGAKTVEGVSDIFEEWGMDGGLQGRPRLMPVGREDSPARGKEPGRGRGPARGKGSVCGRGPARDEESDRGETSAERELIDELEGRILRFGGSKYRSVG